jgi:catechol 2,3-dioxygenase-like lactoylglutathione lyase family enzyme
MSKVVRLQHTSVPMEPGREADARHFYGTVLAMEEKPVPDTIAHLGLIWFRAGDDEIHVFREENLNHKAVGQHICLEVDDIEWYRSQFTTHGVEVEETIGVTNRPRFFVHDPFGNRIEITQVLGDYV